MELAGRNILQVVERQCRRWEIQTERQRLKPTEHEHWPVITISREFGARGETLARIVADRIGYSVWDGELIHVISKETGANEAVLKSLDEQQRSNIEDSIQGALMGGEYMNGDYLRRLMRLVHTSASFGKSIIVGRGANCILDPDSILRVRVVCPLEERIRGYAKRQGLGERQARQKVEKTDRERAVFIRQNFHGDVFNPSEHDLILNTGTLPLERLVPVVLQAYEAKFGQRPPEVQPTNGS